MSSGSLKAFPGIVKCIFSLILFTMLNPRESVGKKKKRDFYISQVPKRWNRFTVPFWTSVFSSRNENTAYLLKVKVKVLSVETTILHRITRKAFHGPTHGKLRSCGKAYLGERLPLCPISVHPPTEKVWPCLHWGQKKSQCPEFLLHNNLVLCSLCGLLRAHMAACVPRWEEI